MTSGGTATVPASAERSPRRHRRSRLLALIAVLAAGALAWSSVAGATPRPVVTPTAVGPMPSFQLPFPVGVSWQAGSPHGTNLASLDFGPFSGTGPVVAAAAGTVQLRTCSGGSVMQVDHGGGWVTDYYHLANPDLSLVGTTVAAGTRLGDAGTSVSCGGGATFNHVHFTIYRDGEPLAASGLSIGGYTVHSTGSAYNGYWTRDSDGATVVTNNGQAACCLLSQSVKPNASATGRTLAGRGVAAGDFNGDGFDDLAVGVPGEDISTSVDAGALNVVLGSATGLSAGSVILYQGAGLAGARESGDGVGAALAAGDLNGDGFDDVVVGVPGEDISTSVDAGALNVVLGSATGLSAGSVILYQGAGLAGARETGDGVGAALAAGDLNGDGFDDLAVGVPEEDISTWVDAGLVNVVLGTASGLTAGSVALHQGGGFEGGATAGDFFGASLTAADVDGDGFDDLTVGVPGEAVAAAADAGVLQVALGSVTGLVTGGAGVSQGGGLAGTAGAGDYLGAALAAGDVNGDGFDDVLAGVPGEDLSSPGDAGALNVGLGGAGGLAGGGPMLYQGAGLAGGAEGADHLGGDPLAVAW